MIVMASKASRPAITVVGGSALLRSVLGQAPQCVSCKGPRGGDGRGGR